MEYDGLMVSGDRAFRGCDEIGELHDEPARPPQGQLTDMVDRVIVAGHELRQPLFAIAIASENLRQMLDRPEIPRERMLRSLDRIDEQVRRSQMLIAETFDRATGRRSVDEPSNLGECLAGALGAVDAYLERSDVSVELRPDGWEATVSLSRMRVEQVIVNVLSNAAESIWSRRQQGWTGEGRIVIEMVRGAGAIVLTLADNGVGVDGTICEAAFRPFFTTRPAGGTGLGLYLCRSILEASGGAISLRSGECEGAVVEIRLPLSAEPAQTA